jgi:hypothetical protein
MRDIKMNFGSSLREFEDILRTQTVASTAEELRVNVKNSELSRNTYTNTQLPLSSAAHWRRTVRSVAAVYLE